jgi:hypothetical protein
MGYQSPLWAKNKNNEFTQLGGAFGLSNYELGFPNVTCTVHDQTAFV